MNRRDILKAAVGVPLGALVPVVAAPVKDAWTAIGMIPPSPATLAKLGYGVTIQDLVDDMVLTFPDLARFQ